MSVGTVNSTSLLTGWLAPGASLFDDLRLLPALLGIVGAVLIMIALSAKLLATKPKPSVDIFHGNMALADFLDSLNYPLNLLVHALMRFWLIDMTPTLCTTEVSLNQICSSASLLSTAFMSVDRYQAANRSNNMPPNGFAYGVVVCLSLLSYIIPGLVQLLPVILPSTTSSLTLSALCGTRTANEICDVLCVLLNFLSLSVTIGLVLLARQTLKRKLKRPQASAPLLSDSLAKEELRLHTVLILQACVSMAAVITDFIRVAYFLIYSSEMFINPEFVDAYEFAYEFESALNAVLVFSLLPTFRTHLMGALRLRKTNRITYVESAHYTQR